MVQNVCWATVMMSGALKDSGDVFGLWVIEATTHWRQSYANFRSNVQNGSHVLKTQAKKCSQQQQQNFTSYRTFSTCIGKCQLNGPNGQTYMCWMGPIKIKIVCRMILSTHRQQKFITFSSVFFCFDFIFFHLCLMLSLTTSKKRHEEMKVKTCKCFPSFHL